MSSLLTLIRRKPLAFISIPFYFEVYARIAAHCYEWTGCILYINLIFQYFQMILYIIIWYWRFCSLGGRCCLVPLQHCSQTRTQNIIAEAENEAKVLKDKKMLEVKENSSQ